MAIVTRYFSTAAAGAGNGTTWADRAALFSGGAWSTVITGFAFNGTDSLRCLIGPGTHTITVTLAGALFANPPSNANPLVMHGCDSSGVALVPPDEDWISPQPGWDSSGLPIIETTTNINMSTLEFVSWRLVYLNATGRNGYILWNSAAYDWCYLRNTTNNASAGLIGEAWTDWYASNCVFQVTGANYAFAVDVGTCHNCRAEGVIGTGGARNGFRGSVNGSSCTKCTAVGFGANGFARVVGGNGQVKWIACSAINNGASGFLGDSTAGQAGLVKMVGSLATGNGAYGLDAQSARIFCAHNRFRDNTSGNVTGLANYPEMDSETTDTDDATEYVNAAGGDYRIKNTAATWGRGFGAGDQAAAGGGGEHAYAFAG